MLQSTLPFPTCPRLPAHGPVTIQTGDQALFFFFGTGGVNTERADELAKELMNAPEKAPEGTIPLQPSVSFYVETPEAEFIAKELAAQTWSSISFIENVSEHHEREWDLLGPYHVGAWVHAPNIVELFITKVPEEP